jgi:protein-S-isoprenylcysteine O-methyltransferase Ste14
MSAGVYAGFVDLTWVYDRYLSLAAAATIISWALSLFLAIYAQRSGDVEVAEPGNSGNVVYDFFMGRELNPRVSIAGFPLDLKYFCELRPGLIGWAFLNVCMAAQELKEFGSISPSMWMVVAFHTYYVIDALWHERSILTTMDITTDGFGMMLAFGDLAWVPFTYSLQARYLAEHRVMLPGWGVATIVLLQFIGLYIFRSANSQKDMFRTNPSDPRVSHLQYLKTERGTMLITSGWWGVSRHVNYFGDWLMGLAWCLPTGFNAILPYFYAVYFGILLIHRERRDEHKCRTKYGKDWEKYCSIVPYRIIPGLY